MLERVSIRQVYREWTSKQVKSCILQNFQVLIKCVILENSSWLSTLEYEFELDLEASDIKK